MDPYSQQPNQGYGPQQYGQNPNQPGLPNQYGQAGYGQPQSQQVPQQAQIVNPQVYQPQGYYAQQSTYQTQQQYPQNTTYNQYGQYAAQSYGSGKTSRFPFSLKGKALIGVAGFVVVLAGIFGITKLSADSPNDLLLTAIENQLKLTSMHVVLSSEAPKLKSTTKVNYYVDFTDVSSPKSAGTVESAFAFLNAKSEVAAEFNANKRDVYVKFSNPAYDSWIVTTDSDEQTLSVGKASNLARVRDLALTSNSIFGIVMSGDFPKDIRANTMKSIKNRSAYTITSTELVSEGNSSVRKYAVKLNKDAIREIQKTASESLAAPFVELSDTEKTYNFFVDTKRKYITKIEQSDSEGSTTITYSEQNQAFEASLPGVSISPDKYLSTLK